MHMYHSHYFRLQKVVKDVNKYLQTQESGPWPQSKVSALDRALGEIGRIMDRKVIYWEIVPEVSSAEFK